MSGDVFSSPGQYIQDTGDKASEYLDPGRNDTVYNFSGKRALDRFGNWYSGPGGESATKIGLAALIAYAGGSLLGLTGGGGEVSNSGMDFGGEGVGWQSNPSEYNWKNDPNSIGNQKVSMGNQRTEGTGTSWQNQMRQGSNMMNQQQQQPTGNPLLNMLLQTRYQPVPYTPIAVGTMRR